MAECEPEQNATSSVKLKINGKSVKLNGFVQNFIAETLLGMVKPLRGVGSVRTLSLNISKSRKSK